MDLESGTAEVTNQVGRGEADQLTRAWLNNRSRLGDLWLGLTRKTGGEEDGKEED